MLHCGAHGCHLTSLAGFARASLPQAQRTLPFTQTALVQRCSRTPGVPACRRRLTHRCTAAASADSAGVSSLEEDDADEEDEDLSDDEDLEDEDTDFDDAGFVSLSEEELAAQDVVFAQDVLTSDMLQADSPDHVAGRSHSRSSRWSSADHN